MRSFRTVAKNTLKFNIFRQGILLLTEVNLVFISSDRKFGTGIRYVVSHIDSQTDLKANPLYEIGFGVYERTHYYGGISMNRYAGVRRCAREVLSSLGEEEEETVFTIPFNCRVNGKYQEREIQENSGNLVEAD